MTDHPYENIDAFAFGDLDTTAGEALLEHADACPACAALLADAMAGVAGIARVDGEQRADDGRSRISRRFHQPARRWEWGAGLAAAAALVLGVWNVQLRASAPVLPIGPLVHSHFQHHALAGNGGSAKAIVALDGSWLYLIGDNLTPRESYTVSVDGKTIGTFDADRSGQATGYWQRPPGKVSSVDMIGSAGTSLSWHGRP